MQVFNNNKKTIMKGIIFWGVLIGILAILTQIFVNASFENENFVQSRNKSMIRIQKEPENTIDVLVVGDSLSYSSISPMEIWNEYGITSYVCGQSGQRIQETYHMIETALQTQSPKVVVLETNVMYRGKDGVASYADTIEQWGAYHVPLMWCHDIWKSFVINKQYPEENYKGYKFRTKVDPYTKGAYMQETTKAKELTKTVTSYMEDIVNLCKENDIQLLLVSVPSPKNYNYQKFNALTAYAKEHGVAYLDMNSKVSEIGIDWQADSLDQGDHLNYLGAQKVSQYLSKYLKENYELADHRSNREYSSWREVALAYNAKVQELNSDK